MGKAREAEPLSKLTACMCAKRFTFSGSDWTSQNSIPSFVDSHMRTRKLGPVRHHTHMFHKADAAWSVGLSEYLTFFTRHTPP